MSVHPEQKENQTINEGAETIEIEETRNHSTLRRGWDITRQYKTSFKADVISDVEAGDHTENVAKHFPVDRSWVLKWVKIMRRFLIAIICLSPWMATSQEDDWSEDDWGDEEDSELPIHAFSDTRVINGHSAEVLNAKTLDFRITHRFGNIATTGSGRTLFEPPFQTNRRGFLGWRHHQPGYQATP